MLTVQPLKSAKGAADYYTAAFNYYANDSQAMRWLGKGAEKLGLEGEVTKGQMLNLLQGKLPDGTVLQDKSGKHRPGFDMTFTAPKSVSILIGLDADKDLIAMHDKAVELAIEKIEKEFAQARIASDGKMEFVNTKNFTIAAFRQPSSRENDPNIHTHAVVMNLTFDEDGKPRSLASDIHGNQGVVEQLQRNVTYAGILYRTNLANMLKEKGYSLLSKPNGLFEISGMPEDIMKDFSRRRTQIEQEMADKGWSGSAGASAATLNTRNTKEEHDINILKADWHQRASNMGFDSKAFVNRQLAPQELNFVERIKDKIFGQFYDSRSIEKNLSLDAVEVAIETVSQKSSVFNYRELKEAALRHCLTGKESISIDSIDKAINSHIESQSLYQATCPYTKKSMLTTPWLLTQESETLARIDANKGVVASISTKSFVSQYQKSYESNSSFPLTASQSRAITQFFTSKDRFNAIQGYAGTGKTTMLKLTQEIAKESGYTLRGLAVASSATDELNHKAGIKSSVFQVVHGELMRAKVGELNKTVFILDEASMLSSTQAHELIKLIEQKGGRLVMVGDDAQLPTVKNGRLFGLSQEYGIETTILDDIIRQKNNNLNQAVNHLVNHEIYDAVSKINEVVTEDSHEKRVARIANDWLSVSAEQRENTLIFASTHKHREEITLIIREQLKEEGTISSNGAEIDVLKAKPIEEHETHYSRYYEKNDVIRFNIQAKRYRINSGDYLTIDTITDKDIKNNTLSLINDEGKKVKFHLNDLPEYKKTRAGLNRHIELYKKETKELCEGDKIQWTRNATKYGVVNSDRAIIKEISPESITVTLSSGDTKCFDKNNNVLKHLDHGYVFTNYKVQGKDKMYGIGLIESYNKFSATLKNFYVQVSRGIYSMKIVTDNENNLIRTLANNDDLKKSAIDHVSTAQLKSHQEKFQSHNQSIDIATVIEKKLHKEDDWYDKQLCLTDYQQAKETGNGSIASKCAYEIVNDRALVRMANHQLGHNYNTYRNDALVYATSQLKETLSPQEQKKLELVEKYINKSKNVQTAWKQVEKYSLDNNLSPNDPKLNLLKTQAFSHTIERNQLAHTFSQDIPGFKPYMKHFSIGDLNRLGVPDYKIDIEYSKSIKKLESLSNQADKHTVKLTVDHYFNSNNKEERKQCALTIQSNSKEAHPYLINHADTFERDVGQCWHEINRDAKIQKDENYRQSLPKDRHKAFDNISHYRKLGLEMSKLGEKYLHHKSHNETNDAAKIGKQLQQHSIQRNEIASKALADDSYKPILNYFNLDKNNIEKQSVKHHHRENIIKFNSTKSDFKQKLLLVNTISQGIKEHYPYIIEQGLDKTKMNKFIRVVNRKNEMDSLNDVQKNDYKKVISYRYQAQKAGQAWQIIFKQKKDNIDTPQNVVNKALQITAKRDSLAKDISVGSEYKTYFKTEKISVDKVIAHANNHNLKLRELRELSEIRHVLLHYLEEKNGQLDSLEAKKWHDNWKDLSKHIGQINWAKNSYNEALKEYPLADKFLPTSHRKLLDKYQLKSTENVGFNHKANANNHSKNIDLTLTVEQLMANPEQTYTSIFGEPKHRGAKEMRYSGGLIVTTKGNNSGLWYDHTAGEGGNPINAIMREKKVSFKEALDIASKLAGTENFTFESTIKQSNTRHIDNDESKKAGEVSAKSIWKGSKSIQNTLAEKYLNEHRGIANTDALNIKYWPKGAKWLNTNDNGGLEEKTNKIPALIIPSYNHKGHITAVQRIYLDEKTAGKNTFMSNAKLSKGTIKGSAGIIQKGEKNERLYVAEGPETAASIAIVDNKATILVSFGLSNIANLDKLIKKHNPSEVIIAGDRDFNPKVDIEKLTNDACNALKDKGIDAKVVLPMQIENNNKTDWNDVLKQQGKNELIKQLGVMKTKSLSNIDNSFNSFKMPVEKSVTILKNLDTLTLINTDKSNINYKITKDISNKIDDIHRGKQHSIDAIETNKSIKQPQKDLSIDL